MGLYRIWGRVEDNQGNCRAIVAAIPMDAAGGPHIRDIRQQHWLKPEGARQALGPLAHSLAASIHARGDRVGRIDLPSRL